MRLWQNTLGIEGVPLKLMIVAIILAITVPLIFSSLRAYDFSRVEQELIAELDEFVATVRMIYTSGPGNSALIMFDVPEGSFAKVECVRMGDALGGTMSSVVGHQLRGRQEVLRLIENPNVPLTSSDNDTLELLMGHHEIRAECELSSIDLNDDGIFPDAYVRLTII